MTMMEWFRNLMTGRYGGDQLNIALVILFFILAMTGQLTDVMLIRWLSLIPVGWSLFRMLSRNHVKRSAENRVFLGLWAPIAGWLRKTAQHLKECKTYRFFKCPKCSQKLRVPRGRGKLEITCPKCKHVIVKKT